MEKISARRRFLWTRSLWRTAHSKPANNFLLLVLVLSAGPLAWASQDGASDLKGTCYVRDIAPRYVSILQSLEESPIEASKQLVELNLCAQGQDVSPSTVNRRLRSVVNRIVSEGETSCLSAVVGLHQDLYFSSFPQIWSSVGRNVSEFSKDLIQLQLTASDSREVDQTVARLIGRYALQKREAGELLEARSNLQRAVNIDHQNLALIQALSTLEEKLGFYSSAEQGFDAWSGLAPLDPEPRLRLALLWKRMGRGQKARKELESLLGNGTGGWVRVVAYQEKARWHGEKRETEKALELLLEAHREFPEEAAFRTQLMHLRPGGRGLPSMAYHLERGRPNYRNTQ